MALPDQTRSDSSAGDNRPDGKITSQPVDINDLRRNRYDSRIIVAGSRDFNDVGIFRRSLANYLRDVHKDKHIAFISGKAKRGADNLIIDWCELTPFRVFTFEAQWKSALGKGAGFVRNEEMGLEGSHLLAYWDGVSRGTKHMIDFASEKGLDVHIVDVSKFVVTQVV